MPTKPVFLELRFCGVSEDRAAARQCPLGCAVVSLYVYFLYFYISLDSK
jgi:hypothetical protein